MSVGYHVGQPVKIDYVGVCIIEHISDAGIVVVDYDEGDHYAVKWGDDGEPEWDEAERIFLDDDDPVEEDHNHSWEIAG